jgi:hypothetical protein
VVFFALAPMVCAQQAAAPKRTGVPQDWSQRHIVFSREGLALHPELMDREPRILHQSMLRGQASKPDALRMKKSPPPPKRKPGLERDWNHRLPGRLAANMYPAKFSFDASAPPDCTNDYVVFGLARPGVVGGAANLVAFNNLYVNSAGTGLCNGTAPNVLFAYNITTVKGGKISTSPILSLDGTQIGFVESVPATVGPPATPAQAIFHVLTWSPGQGTPLDSAAPSMTSLTLSTSVNDTTSSPWIDYFRDIVYVGLDDGTVHQITGVFYGTLGESGSPWPVIVSSGSHLTAPVLDSSLGQLMVGSADGSLYKIDTSSGVLSALAVGKSGATGAGIVGAPIVDITNGTTFVVSSNNGTSAVLVEADTASLSLLSEGPIGEGSFSGTVVSLYEPAFDNNYYNDPSTGTIQLCGTGSGDTTPWQYAFGFDGSTMNETPVAGFPVPLSTSTTDRCTGWTEFFNPNAGAADTITATAVASDVLTVTANNSDLSVGEELYIQGTKESFLNGGTVIIASLIGSAPTYTGFTASFTTTDYSTTPDTGTVSPADTITATRVASNVLTVTATNSNLTVGQEVSIQGTAESFLNGQTVTVASLIGSVPPYTGFTASFTNPDYSNPSDAGTVFAVSAGTDFFFFGLTGDCESILGGTTTTGCVVALANNVGATTATTAAVTGGPSGIVVDNYSAAAQASSVYLMGNRVNTAYKFTQTGLQ